MKKIILIILFLLQTVFCFSMDSKIYLKNGRSIQAVLYVKCVDGYKYLIVREGVNNDKQ